MSNTSGRITEVHSELDFPGLDAWFHDIHADKSKGTLKKNRIALEQFDAFLIDEMGVTDEMVLHDFETFISGEFPRMETFEDKGNELMRRFSKYLANDVELSHATIPGRWYAVRKYLNQMNIVSTHDYNWDGIGYIEPHNPKFEGNYILDWLDKGSESKRQFDDDYITWLSLEDLQKLIDGAKNTKNEMVIRCLIEFGCRPRELSEIELESHNPKMRSFEVDTLKIDDPNHRLNTREVFYSRQMREYVKDWLDRGGRLAYSGSDGSDRLIVGYNSPKLGAIQINEIVKMAADAAGLQDSVKSTGGRNINKVTARTLRHSFAVHAVRGVEQTGTPSMDIERLRLIMGHKSLESTKSYLQFRGVEVREAFDECHPTMR